MVTMMSDDSFENVSFECIKMCRRWRWVNIPSVELSASVMLLLGSEFKNQMTFRLMRLLQPNCIIFFEIFSSTLKGRTTLVLTVTGLILSFGC